MACVFSLCTFLDPWIALLAVLFLVVVLFTFVGVLFWMTRPFKVVFMKVELKPSPLYASGERQDSAKGSSTSAPSSITPVVVMSRTTMPPLRSVLRALYRQRKIHNLTELDGKSRGMLDSEMAHTFKVCIILHADSQSKVPRAFACLCSTEQSSCS